MKKLITICVGLIVSGYAAAAQPDEANAKIQDLEKKLEAADTKIQDLEKRLSAIENIRMGPWCTRRGWRLVELTADNKEVRQAEKKAAWEAEEERKRVEAEKAAAKEAEEKKVVDAKIDAFLKEYLGVQFGDSIDKFPEAFDKDDSNTRVVTMLKKFKYFDKAYGEFFDGRLYRVVFYVDIEDKYSIDSTNEKIDKSLAELAESFGLSSTPFKDGGYLRNAPNTSYRFGKNQISGAPRQNIFSELRRQAALGKGSLSMPQPEFRRYEASIADSGLKERLENDKRKAEEEALRKKNAEGETLPDPE